MATTLLVIAAHPGDAVFTMGATLAQHIHSGGQGVMVSLSAGEKGAPADIPVEKYGELQRAATRKAAGILGAQFEIMNYPDAEIPFNERVAQALGDVIRQHQADIVLTHWSGSWHKDHQNCHLLVRDAIFFAGLASMNRQYPAYTVRKLFFADNWEDADNFKPDTYLDISPVYGKWLQACDAYPMWRGQTGFFRYNDYYSSLAVMRGCLAGFRHAAALMTGPAERVKGVNALL